MIARKGVFSSIGRAGAAAMIAAVALTAVEPSMAFAGSAPSGKGVTATTGTSDVTDFSARRYYRGGYYRGGGGAAAAAAFAGIVGTGLAIAAAQNRSDYYDSYGYYDAPPVRKIVAEARSNDYRFSSVILGIVKSPPFQMRRSEP